MMLLFSKLLLLSSKLLLTSKLLLLSSKLLLTSKLLLLSSKLLLPVDMMDSDQAGLDGQLLQSSAYSLKEKQCGRFRTI